ncbi:transcription factor bHLH110 [Ricinus communis]|uniref:BHLH domain-containing protein n=1 Tax=Ricinus communis TaxID=3988 RepID=B9S6A6_RICCO|nr:transcription factor bHLH110 [Ricinus communis]EEF40796.1 conserved hypothetical protein [Ricinus communis]|eukprot:XP_002521525.1 transcription factor bHLH110 [Ricinus communis]
MEPANLHHPQHHLQEQLAGYYSSLLLQPDYYMFSNLNNMHPGFILDSWATNRSSNICGQGLMGFPQQSANEFLLANIKEEMPDSFPKLSEVAYTSPCNIEESHSLSTKTQYPHELGDHNHFLTSNGTSFSSGHRHHHIPELQLSAGELPYINSGQNSASLENSSSASNRYDFRHSTLQSLKSSNSNSCFSLLSNSLDLNLQVLDLLNPTYGAASPNSHGHYFMGQLKDSPSSSSNKASIIEDGIDRKRRYNSSFPESKNFSVEAKKHKPASQLSSPPSKVIKKEKIREKIATLQRLVAPYGKTDTASVLTDTIGYIQFLHDQVKTLSVPYMRPRQSKLTRTVKESLSKEDGKGQPKRDLLSRGLYLVPTPYASFIDSYNGGI